MYYRNRYRSLISVTVRKEKIQFSDKTIRTVGTPTYILVYTSKENKQLFIKACTQEENSKIQIRNYGTGGYVIANVRLAKHIMEISGVSEPKKYLGKYMPEYEGIMFDLANPKKIGYGKRTGFSYWNIRDWS
ncbi:MAG: hypothetical protein IK034_02590 [Bacilli bacterium]|nr:hypothetical protein [Bacilli bacterium]